MSGVILRKMGSEPPVCEREILRYAGCREANEETAALLSTCLSEVKDKLAYSVCYGVFPVRIEGDTTDFGAFSLPSAHLARNLHGCETAILFAATVGVEIDRLISKYGRLSPAKALLLQAIGTERIEALCDAFCADMAKEYQTGTKPRFSPGYGDLPLAAQKDLFAVLRPERHIGLTLTDRLLMSPSKSVTAILGLGGEEKQSTNQCSGCQQPDCLFRGVAWTSENI